MDVKILVQGTPNPNALKFVVNRPVKTQGNVTFSSPDVCGDNKLAAALFTIANISEVYFFDNYITITQDGSADWDDIEEQAKQIILDNIEHHDPDFQSELEQKPKERPSDPQLAAIEDILDRTIRPALQMDGGDLKVLGLSGDSVLTIAYQGACGSCPSSAMGTLQAIENILKDEYNPELKVELGFAE